MPKMTKESLMQEVEVDPRSVTSFESEVKDPVIEKQRPFYEVDLRRQIWLFCKREDIDYGSLEWSEIVCELVNPKDPKGLRRYSVSVKIPHPKALGRTTAGASVVYTYEFLIQLGIIEEIK
jgi:hypothetical protein